MAITRTIARPTGNQRIGSLAYTSTSTSRGNRWVGNQDQSPFLDGMGTRHWAVFGRARHIPNTGTALLSLVSAETGDTNTGLTAIRLHINGGTGMGAFGSTNRITMTRITSGIAANSSEHTLGTDGNFLVNYVGMTIPGTSGAEYKRFQVGSLQGDNTFTFGTAGNDTNFRQSAGVPFNFRTACTIAAGTGFRVFGGYSTADASSSYHCRGIQNAQTFIVLNDGVTFADIGLDDSETGRANWRRIMLDPQQVFYIVGNNGVVVSYGDPYESDGTTRIQVDNTRVLVGGEKLVAVATDGVARALTLEADAEPSRRPTLWPDYSPVGFANSAFAGLAIGKDYQPQMLPVPGSDTELFGAFHMPTNAAGVVWLFTLHDRATGRMLKPAITAQSAYTFFDSSNSFSRGENVGIASFNGGTAPFSSASGDNHRCQSLSILNDRIVSIVSMHHDRIENRPDTGDWNFAWNCWISLDDNGPSPLLKDVVAAAFPSSDQNAVGYLENTTSYGAAMPVPGGTDSIAQIRLSSTLPGRFAVQKLKADNGVENCVLSPSLGGSLRAGYSTYGMALPGGLYLATFNARAPSGDAAAKPFCAVIDTNGDISNGANVYAPMTGAPCDGVGGNPTLGAIATDNDDFNLFGEEGENTGTTASALKAVGGLRWIGSNPAGTLLAAEIGYSTTRNATQSITWATDMDQRDILVWSFNPTTKTLTRVSKTSFAGLLTAIGITDREDTKWQMVTPTGALHLIAYLKGTTKTDGVHRPALNTSNHPVGDAIRAVFFPNIFTQPGTYVDLGDIYDCGNTGSGSNGVGGKGCAGMIVGQPGPDRLKTALIEVTLSGVQQHFPLSHIRAVDLTALLAPYEGGRRIQIIPIDDELVPLPMRV